MPWVDQPKAIVEAYLGGEAVGEATVDILFGQPMYMLNNFLPSDKKEELSQLLLALNGQNMV